MTWLGCMQEKVINVEKCELLLLYTVIDYMGWGGVSKDLTGCVDALS